MVSTGTRSAQMIVGLLVIAGVGLVANYFDLLAVKWIVSSLKTVWLIVFVILFQPELRHALAQFGRGGELQHRGVGQADRKSTRLNSSHT